MVIEKHKNDNGSHDLLSSFRETGRIFKLWTLGKLKVINYLK